MLKKTFLYFIIILIGFSLFLKFIPNDLDTDQSQWGENIIKAQNYLYELTDEDIENVILGSSLSNRILTDSLSKNFTNLAFSGLSVWDGFKLIDAKTIKPKAIFIETNVIFRNENLSFSDYTLSPIRKNPKEYIDLLKEKNQPVGVLKGLIYYFRGGKKKNINFDSTSVIINPELLSIQKKDFTSLPEKNEIEKLFLKLNDQVSTYKNIGIEIYFFEMPMHPELENSDKMQLIRKKISEIAKRNNILILPNVNPLDYATTDGIHLDPFNALKYTRFLKNEILK